VGATCRAVPGFGAQFGAAEADIVQDMFVELSDAQQVLMVAKVSPDRSEKNVNEHETILQDDTLGVCVNVRIVAHHSPHPYRSR
jgi:hypothetical protein